MMMKMLFVILSQQRRPKFELEFAFRWYC